VFDADGRSWLLAFWWSSATGVPSNAPPVTSAADTVRVGRPTDCEAVIEELNELLASFALVPGVVAEGAGCADEMTCVGPLEGTAVKSHSVRVLESLYKSPRFHILHAY
jgi:hypothetical protein